MYVSQITLTIWSMHVISIHSPNLFISQSVSLVVALYRTQSMCHNTFWFVSTFWIIVESTKIKAETEQDVSCEFHLMLLDISVAQNRIISIIHEPMNNIFYTVSIHVLVYSIDDLLILTTLPTPFFILLRWNKSLWISSLASEWHSWK